MCVRIHSSTNENIIIIKLEEKKQNRNKTNENVCNGLGEEKIRKRRLLFQRVGAVILYNSKPTLRWGERRKASLLTAGMSVYTCIYREGLVQLSAHLSVKSIFHGLFSLFRPSRSRVVVVVVVAARAHDLVPSFSDASDNTDDRLRWRAWDKSQTDVVERRKIVRDRNRHQGLTRRRTSFSAV